MHWNKTRPAILDYRGAWPIETILQPLTNVATHYKRLKEKKIVDSITSLNSMYASNGRQSDRTSVVGKAQNSITHPRELLHNCGFDAR